MANNSFKVKNSLVLTPVDLSTLVSPQAGDLACDINDNNKIKRYDANAAAWTEVGSGGVGGVDIFFVQDFESASLNTFSGTSGAQVGLVLTQTDPLKGKVSALLTHQAGTSPTNDQSFKQIIPVDRKFRGIPMVLRLDSKSDASQGNVTIKITDETNTVDLVASEQLQLSNDTAGKKTSVAFTLPATCASFSYTITALPESGKVTRIDDIICEMAETALLETAVQVPVVTSWASYTPTFQGFGTPTNIGFEWRQVGESVEIRGKFTSGTSTAVEARIGLPAGLTSAGTSLIPSLQTIGDLVANTQASTYFRSSVIIEPSVSYVTFGNQTSTSNALTKINGTAFGTGTTLSFFASVPCAGLSATTTKAIPLTQSGLVQEADSMIRVSGANGFNGTKRLFSSIIQNIGNDISYIASTGQFIAQKAGIYNISWSEATSVNTTAMSIVLQLNNTDIAYDNQVQNTASTSVKYASVSWQGYLNQGDIITCNVNNTAEFNGLASTFTMSRAGSLKQIAVSSDQKLTIPTSELRFEGASARGTGTESAIVQFTSLAKLRGDAFEINNSNGTAITMKKAGRLSISSAIYQASSGYIVISRNQSNRTTGPTATETLIASGSGATGAGTRSATWVGDVSIGDVIRIYSSVVPSAANDNNLNLSFQEQDISISVTNTLPQFSESDSSVRVDTANGYGSTLNNKIRRFSNQRDNVGSDIEYVDDPANGATFTVKSSGIYEISYTDSFSTLDAFGISKNASSLTTAIQSIATSERLALDYPAALNAGASVSWTGYLASGDIIRPHAASGGNGSIPARTHFTISKVGKPNVTGVDVTPFVNVPQPQTQSSYLSQTATFGIAIITGALASSNGSNLFSYNSSSGLYTVLKRGNFTINASLKASTTASCAAVITVDSSSVALAHSDSSGAYWATASYSQILNPGQTFSISNQAGGNTSDQRISVVATALSDQILTAPETFSTDTAALTYASSSLYNLTTLANAPVGTYITFTYAANTNTRTQTTTRPTQTDADMNANGILVYQRAYNAASTAGQPAAIDIQIGKGLKGVSLGLYKSSGKTTSGSLDYFLNITVEKGFSVKSYNEVTGVLSIDAGFKETSSNTTGTFLFSDITNQASGYLVINASKNASLTGMNIERVSAFAGNSSGTSISNASPQTLIYDSAKSFDTNGALNTSTGVFTAPETGFYQVSAAIRFQTSTYAINNTVRILLVKNGTVVATSGGCAAQTTTAVALGENLATTVYCVKGDALRLDILNNRTAGSTPLNTAYDQNYFSISKVNIGGKS